MSVLLTALRSNNKFHGEALETILLTPPKGTIAAHQLLVIGLGNKNDFTPELMTKVARVGMLEALRLGVASYALEGYEASLFLEKNTWHLKTNSRNSLCWQARHTSTFREQLLRNISNHDLINKEE